MSCDQTKDCDELVEAPRGLSVDSKELVMIDTPPDPNWRSVSEGVGGSLDFELPKGPAGLLFWEDRSRLSRGTIERIKKKYKLGDSDFEEKPKKLHPATRKKRRRAKYWKYERAGKARRDSLEKSTPERMWRWYRTYQKKKGLSWDVTLEEFVLLMSTTVDDVEGGEPVELFNYDFYIYRKDKSSKSFNINNIIIKDRYTNNILYK